MQVLYKAFQQNPAGTVLVSEHTEMEYRQKGYIGKDAELLWEFEASTPDEATEEHLRRLNGKEKSSGSA